MRIRRSTIIATTAILATCGLAAVALALPAVTTSGTTQLGMVNKSDTASQATSSVAWVSLLEAAATSLGVPVVVPDGKRVLVNARFTAETTCYGPAGNGCRARIIVVAPTGAIIELNPASGADYYMDTAFPAPNGAIDHEGHAMERSIILGQGTYTLRVQRSVTNAAVLFTLDDWHLAVETTVVP